MFRPRILAIAISFALIMGFSAASAAPAKRVLANPQLPVMVGTGETIKVTPGRWSQRVTLTYQWLLDGRLIKSATKSSYTVPVSALGHKLALVETAKFSDGKKLFATADSRVVGLLKVTGGLSMTRDDVNKKLKLSAPSVNKVGVTTAIKWFASGSLIQGARTNELAIDKRFESLPVYAKQTFSAAGYNPLTLTSNSINFAAPQPTENVLLWSDEFNGEVGSGPNLLDWNDVVGNGRNPNDPNTPVANGWGNLERQYYLPGQAKVAELAGATDNKGLLITALEQKTNPVATGPYDCFYSFNFRGQKYDPAINCDWVSGKITTEDKIGFLYGHLEARIKTIGTTGTWSAFWMLGSDYQVNGWPACGEIDIHEGNGGIPNTNWGTLHGFNYWPGGSVTKNTSILAEWHTYALDWKPDYIAFSVDGVVYKTITASDLTKSPWNLNLENAGWEFNKPQFAILNLAIGGRIIGNNNAIVKVTDITTDTKTMQIDYIRYSTLDGYGTLIRN